MQEGARVAITGRNPETIENARKELGNEVLIMWPVSRARNFSGIQ